MYSVDIADDQIGFEGALVLEGPLLEAVIAAYLLSKGCNVIRRVETGGVQHDILVERHDGYVFYECTGQREVTAGKVQKFLVDAYRLDEVLRKLEDKPLLKAVFVAAVAPDTWTEDAKHAMELAAKRIKEKLGAEVEVWEGLNLLRELISSGVLGLRLYRNRIYFAGPADYGIRVLEGEFKMGLAPIGIGRFRELPHSFYPSYYWEMYYQNLLREAMEGKDEPPSIWSYPYREGVRWRSVSDLAKAEASYVSSFDRRYVLESGDDYLVEERVSLRRNRYYSIHVFTNAEVVDSRTAASCLGRALLKIDELKEKREYLRGEYFSIRIHSSTSDWSSKAWGEASRIPSRLKEEVSTVHIERGEELVLRLLNRGVLGLGFKEKNIITIYGPGVKAIRRTPEGIKISSKGAEVT